MVTPPLSSTPRARTSISLLFCDQPEIVAQPLHQRAGDGDGAFQRIDRLRLAEPIAHRREQSAFRRIGRLAGVHQHEAAGAVGVLGLALLEAGLPHQGRLLVAENAGDRHAGEDPSVASP